MPQKRKAPADLPEPKSRKARAQCNGAGALSQSFKQKLESSGLDKAESKKLQFDLCATPPNWLKLPAPGFVIPYFDLAGKPTGFCRYRYLEQPKKNGFAKLIDENGKPLRYTQPPGTLPELYLPPLADWRAIAADPAQPLVITEGELKAACGTHLTQYPTIGLGGVDCWHARNRLYLDRFDEFAWQGRHVFIVFDSDAVTNENVQRAERGLAALLVRWGALVHVVRLPYSATAKIGLDDYVTAHGTDDFNALVDGTPPYRADAASVSVSYQRKVGEAAATLHEIAWLVKGVLPARGIAQVYGPPGSGKTFLTLDMALAIAYGAQWFGYRVQQAPVTYLFLEGEAGAGQRLRAWERRHNEKLPPAFGAILQPFNITSDGHVQALADALPENGVLFIDTQARAAPGIDENANDDMSRILSGAKTLADRYNGMVVLVAHTGKDAAKGVRGHSSQAAAMDAAIEVSKGEREGESNTWRTAKLKDGRDGQTHPFKLDSVELGKDADGDVITSCVVNANAPPPAPKRARGVDAKLLVEAYKKAGLAGAGIVQDHGFIGVHENALRAAFYKIKDGQPNAQRAAFSRGVNSLRTDAWFNADDHVCRVTEPSVEALELEFVAAATGQAAQRSKVAKTIKTVRK